MQLPTEAYIVDYKCSLYHYTMTVSQELLRTTRATNS